MAALQDEGTSAASGICYKVLEMIGGRRPFQTAYRGSFAMIGYKGKQNVTWIQQLKQPRFRGPTVIKTSIKLLTK